MQAGSEISTLSSTLMHHSQPLHAHLHLTSPLRYINASLYQALAALSLIK